MTKKAVDERIVKVTMDAKDIEKKGPQIKKNLSGMFDGLKKAFSKIDTKGAANAMDKFNSAISKSAERSKSLIGRIRDTFSKSFSKIDTSGVSRSVQRMNTELSNSVNKAGTILGQLKTVFSKTSFGDGFSEIGNSANKMTSVVTNALGSLTGSIGRVDASPIADSFQNASTSASNSLSIIDIALGTLAGNVATKALSIAGNFANQFTQGARDGFREFELKMGSVQTILANTKKYGTTLTDVNGALGELNDYADKTIYNFGDMTSAIGRFTTSGMDLDTSVLSIKGMANAAALAGANATDLSRAYYQVSQAMSQGFFQKMDWMSVRNANMATEELKQTLIDLGREHGTITDEMEVDVKNFESTLTEGKWLTAEVWADAMARYADETTELGKRATEAAQQVKTFSHMVDTIKEDIGSGWAETWEYVFGNFEEGVALWTGINQQVSSVIGIFADARNSVFKEWHDGGGYQAFWNGVLNIISAVAGVFRSIATAFSRVFGAGKGVSSVMISISQAFEKVTSYIQPGTEGFGVLVEIFTILFNVIKIGLTIVGTFIRIAMIPLKIVALVVGAALRVVVGVVELLAKGINFVLSPIANLISYLGDLLGNGLKAVSDYITGKMSAAFEFLLNIWNRITSAASSLVAKIKELDEKFKVTASVVSFFKSILEGALTGLKVIILGVISILTAPFRAAWDLVGGSIKKVVDLVKKSTDSLSKLSDIFRKAYNSLSYFNKLPNNIEKVKTSISNLFKSIGDRNWDGFKKAASDIFISVKDVYSSFATTIKQALGVMFNSGVFKDLYKEFESALKPLTDVFNTVKNTMTKAYETAAKVSKNFYDNHLKSHVDKYAGYLKRMYDGIIAPTVSKYADIANAKLLKSGIDLSGFKRLGDALKGIFNSDELKISMHAFKSNFNGLIQGILDGNKNLISNSFTNLVNGAKFMTKSLAGVIAYGFNEVFNFTPLTNYISQQLAPIKELVDRVLAPFKYYLSGFDVGNLQHWKLLFMLIGIEVQKVKSYLAEWMMYLGYNMPTLDNLKADFKKLAEAAKEVFGHLRNWDLEGVFKSFQKFNELFAGTGLQKIFLGIIGTGFAAYAYSIWRAIHKWGSLIGTVKDFVEGLSEAGEAAKNVPKTFKKANVMFKLMGAAALIAGLHAFASAVKKIAEAMEILAKLDTEQLKKSALVVSLIMGELVLSMKLLGKTDPKMKNVFQLLALAAAIKMLGKSVEEIGNMDLATLAKGGLVVSAIMMVMSISVKLMNSGRNAGSIGNALSLLAMAKTVEKIGKSIEDLAKLDNKTIAKGGLVVTAIMQVTALSIKLMNSGRYAKTKGSATTIVAMSAAVYIIGKSIEKLGSLSLGTLAQGGYAATAIIGVMGIITRLLNRSYDKDKRKQFKSVSIILSLAASVFIIGRSIERLGNLSIGTITQGGLAVTAIMGAMALAVRLMSMGEGTVTFRSAFSMIVMVGSIHALGMAVATLGLIPKKTLDQGMDAVVGLMGILTVLTAMMSMIDGQTGGAKSALTIVGFAIALNLLVPPIILLGTLKFSVLAKGLLTVAGGLLAMGFAMKMMNSGGGNLAGIAQIAVMAGVLIVLAGVMTTMGSLSWEAIAKGMVVMAGALGLLIGSAFAAQFVAPGLTVLSAVLVALGFALGGIGALLAGAAYAFQVFSSATGSEVDKVVENFARFIQTLAEKSGEIGYHAGQILIKFLNGLSQNTTELVTMGIKWVIELLKGIKESAGELMNAAGDLIEALLKGLREQVPKVVPELVNLLSDIVIQAIDALIPKVDEVAPKLAQLFESIFRAGIGIFVGALRGIIQPILDVLKEVWGAIEPIVMPIVDTFNNVVSQISPILQSLADVIRSVGDTISSILVSLAASIDTVLNGIADLFVRTLEAVRPVLEEIGNIITKAGDAIKTALEGVSGVIDSVGGVIEKFFSGIEGVIKAFGDAAEKAGKGFDKLADGVVKITDTKLGDLAASLREVKNAVASLADNGEGMKTAGDGMNKIAKGLLAINQNTGSAANNMTIIATAVSLLHAPMGLLPDRVVGLSMAFKSLMANTTGLGLVLMSVNGPVLSLNNTFASMNNMIIIFVAALGRIGDSMGMLNTGFMLMNAAMTAIRDNLIGLNTGISTLHTWFNNIVSSMGQIAIGLAAITNSFSQLSSSALILITALLPINNQFGTMANMFKILGDTILIANNGIMALSNNIVILNNGMTFANTSLLTLSTNLRNVGSTLPTLVLGFVGLSTSISSSMNVIQSSIVRTFTSSIAVIRGGISMMISTISSGVANIRSSFQTMSASISTNMRTAGNHITTSTAKMVAAIRQAGNQMQSAGLEAGRKFASNIRAGIDHGVAAASAAANRLANHVASAVRSGYNGMYNSGAYLTHGVANGMDSALWRVTQAANRIIHQAHRAAQAAANIHSPSRLFRDSVGKYIGQGIAVGIDQSSESVTKSAKAMITTISGVLNPTTFEDLFGDGPFNDDEPYTPTIIPVVDTSNVDKFYSRYSQFKMRGDAIVNRPIDRTGRPGFGDSSSGSITNNSEVHYDIHVNVQNSTTANPRELAREIEREIRYNQQRNDWSLGNEVII